MTVSVDLSACSGAEFMNTPSFDPSEARSFESAIRQDDRCRMLLSALRLLDSLPASEQIITVRQSPIPLAELRELAASHTAAALIALGYGAEPLWRASLQYVRQHLPPSSERVVAPLLLGALTAGDDALTKRFLCHAEELHTLLQIRAAITSLQNCGELALVFKLSIERGFSSLGWRVFDNLMSPFGRMMALDEVFPSLIKSRDLENVAAVLNRSAGIGSDDDGPMRFLRERIARQLAALQIRLGLYPDAKDTLQHHHLNDSTTWAVIAAALIDTSMSPLPAIKRFENCVRKMHKGRAAAAAGFCRELVGATTSPSARVLEILDRTAEKISHPYYAAEISACRTIESLKNGPQASVAEGLLGNLNKLDAPTKRRHFRPYSLVRLVDLTAKVLSEKEARIFFRAVCAHLDRTPLQDNYRLRLLVEAATRAGALREAETIAAGIDPANTNKIEAQRLLIVAHGPTEKAQEIYREANDQVPFAAFGDDVGISAFRQLIKEVSKTCPDDFSSSPSEKGSQVRSLIALQRAKLAASAQRAELYSLARSGFEEAAAAADDLPSEQYPETCLNLIQIASHAYLASPHVSAAKSAHLPY